MMIACCTMHIAADCVYLMLLWLFIWWLLVVQCLLLLIVYTWCFMIVYIWCCYDFCWLCILDAVMIVHMMIASFTKLVAAEYLYLMLLWLLLIIYTWSCYDCSCDDCLLYKASCYWLFLDAVMIDIDCLYLLLSWLFLWWLLALQCLLLIIYTWCCYDCSYDVVMIVHIMIDCYTMLVDADNLY